MAFSTSFVEQACKVLQQINPKAVNIFTEAADNQSGVMFRNAVVTIVTDQAGHCQKIYTDIQFMQDAQKDLFVKQSADLPGAFVLELEQEITRIGFK